MKVQSIDFDGFEHMLVIDTGQVVTRIDFDFLTAFDDPEFRCWFERNHKRLMEKTREKMIMRPGPDQIQRIDLT